MLDAYYVKGELYVFEDAAGHCATGAYNLRGAGGLVGAPDDANMQAIAREIDAMTQKQLAKLLWSCRGDIQEKKEKSRCQKLS